jgi:hypothetical protein
MKKREIFKIRDWQRILKIIIDVAGVAELVDARDLKSLAPKGRTGSSPVSGILFFKDLSLSPLPFSTAGFFCCQSVSCVLLSIRACIG